MPKWNKGLRGHKKSSSWVQISHYLPHKPSWLEAKVRQAGGHSWVQRLNHPSSKWPAFDQPCHFCHEGDPRDQTTSASQSMWWLTFNPSLSTLQSKTKGNFYFVVMSASQHKVTSWERAAFFCLIKPFFMTSPYIHTITCVLWEIIKQTGRN